MTARQREKLIKTLVRAREAIRNGWTQNQESRLVFGRQTVCAVGALNVGLDSVLPRNVTSRYDGSNIERAVLRSEAENFLVEAITELHPDQEMTTSMIPTWNDEPDRKKSEVLDAFDRALKIAERDG